MIATSRAISYALVMLVALLVLALPFPPTIAQEPVRLNIGLVGKVSGLEDLYSRSVAANNILTMIADSLYKYSNTDKAISPELAEGWPSFSPDGKSVTVRIKKEIDPNMTGLFSLGAISKTFDALSKQIGGVTVLQDQAGNSLTFKYEADSTSFWDLLAFAPIFAATEDGTIIGAGYPEYKLSMVDGDGLKLDPMYAGALTVYIKGFKDQASMIQAYTEGAIDYCMTDLTRAAAQLKGQNWQSASDAVLMLVMNPGSSVFGSVSVRSAALSLVDRSYIVLRALPGRATQSAGLYFPGPSVDSGSSPLAGLKVRLLSASKRLDSLEMLCSMLIKSWWEKDGASVSINLPSDKPDADARIESGDFDALVLSVWLRPGFTGLSDKIGKGGIMLEPYDQELKPLLAKLKSPKSFDEMKEAASMLEALLQRKYLVLPLFFPVRTELYRPDKFQGWNSKLGEPLISSYGDFARITAIAAP